jgi:addiction module HigA family antidote
LIDKPITVGEVLKKEFLEPLGIPQTELARNLGLQFMSVANMIKGRADFSASMAMRLSY